MEEEVKEAMALVETMTRYNTARRCIEIAARYYGTQNVRAAIRAEFGMGEEA